jgi:hypothetical protein
VPYGDAVRVQASLSGVEFRLTELDGQASRETAPISRPSPAIDELHRYAVVIFDPTSHA